jgi:AcrR family transcriptional regulator
MRAVDKRPALTTEHIIETATRLIEDGGLDAFSMRALGRELGTSAMAVYGHFASREELLGAVSEAFWYTMDDRPISGERWDDTLRRTMNASRDACIAHPHLAALANDPTVAALGFTAHYENVIEMHLAQGMPPELLKRAWTFINTFLVGFSASEGFLEATGKMYADKNGIDPNHNPPFWQQVLDEAYTDESYHDGIELVIAAIRSMAAPDPCEWYTP